MMVHIKNPVWNASKADQQSIGRSSYRVLVALVTVFFAASWATAKQKPNFLIILADNVGRDWLSCYGATQVRTPNIDRLASQGLRFEHFYSTPLCSTTRIEFLTGRYGLRTGWHTHHDPALYGGGGFDPAREVTWARALRDKGYATVVTGKWQINDLYAEPDAIRRHGFDEHLVWTGARPGSGTGDERWRAAGQPIADGHFESRYWDPVVFRNGRREVLAGRFGPDAFVDYLCDFIARHREQPFVAYYATPLPALPAVPTPLSSQRNATEAEMFAGMVLYLDMQVGRLETELARFGLRENTIIFFAGDNATPVRLAGPTARARERGGVRLMTEFDLDMPLIVNGPGVPTGRVTDALVDASDVFPTLLALAGIPLPHGITLDGRSFARLIGGPADEATREWIFAQYGPVRAVRDTRFKLYSTSAFYDLAADPMEKIKLSAGSTPEMRDACARLQRVLDGMPADARLPFRYRSSNAFQMEAGTWKY